MIDSTILLAMAASHRLLELDDTAVDITLDAAIAALRDYGERELAYELAAAEDRLLIEIAWQWVGGYGAPTPETAILRAHDAMAEAAHHRRRQEREAADEARAESWREL